MSAIVDCPACQFGNHKGHKWDWKVTPGLLGGAVCGCKDDCKRRAEARSRRMAERWFGMQKYRVEVERTYRAIATVEAIDTLDARNVVDNLIAEGDLDQFVDEWKVDYEGIPDVGTGAIEEVPAGA